jgi:predicted DNA-binding transcriptional regulator YafY
MSGTYRGGNGRELFRRVVYLHGRLREGRVKSCSSEAGILGVCRRTVRRDIGLLRDLGAPVEYDPINERWRYVRDWSLDDVLSMTV